MSLQEQPLNFVLVWEKENGLCYLSLGHVCVSVSVSVVQGVSCSFFHRVQQKLGSQAQLRQLGMTSAWDIEDLVKMGRKVRVSGGRGLVGCVPNKFSLFGRRVPTLQSVA